VTSAVARGGVNYSGGRLSTLNAQFKNDGANHRSESELAYSACRPAEKLFWSSTGEDTCRQLRSWTQVPILVLSARHSDAEKVALFDAGGDDYVTKPFSPAELKARVRALLRRAKSDGAASGTKIVREDLEIDLDKRTVKLGGSPVHVTPIEWDLLIALATNPGRVMTHQQLFTAVWRGRDHGDAQQYLRVYVAHLRRKLESDPVHPRFIFTIPAVGYRFGP